MSGVLVRNARLEKSASQTDLTAIRRSASLLVLCLLIEAAFFAHLFTQDADAQGCPTTNACITSGVVSIGPTPRPAYVGAPYTLNLSLVGSTGTTTWTLVSGSATQGGITFSTATGSFSGTPTGTSALSWTVKGVGSTFGQAQTIISLTALALLNSSSIAVTPTGQSIQTNQTLQLTATATWSNNTTTNITNFATWTPACGTSSGCTVSSSGLFTAGIAAGSPSVTAALNSSTSPADTITVSTNNPTFQTSSLATGQQGITYPGSQLACSGGAPPYVFAVNSGTLPTGLSLSTAGAISGIVNLTATSQTLTFKCTDTASAVGTSGSITLTVATLSSVSISPLTPSIQQGGTQQFTLTGNYTSPSGTANVTNLVTGGSGGSLAIAQICNTGSAGVAGPVVINCTIPAGHLVNVWIRSPDASDTFSATDSASQSYTQPSCSPANTNSNAIGTFYFANTSALTTVTVNDTMGANISAEVIDIAGGATSAPLDVCPSAVTTSGATSLQSSALTTTNANDILLWGVGTNTQTSHTPTSPFTIPTGAFVAGRLSVANEIVSAAQTALTTSTSWPASAPANGIIAAFEAASSTTGWSSSNITDISINGSGLATAHNVGTGITIQGCVTMSLCASTTATVTGVADSGLIVSPNPASAIVGGSAQNFTAKGNNSGNPYSITVQSSNQAIATTSGANATCVAQGTVTITASGGGLTGTAPLNCSPQTTGSALLTGCGYVNAFGFTGGCPVPTGWTAVAQQDFECSNSHAGPTANPGCGQIPPNQGVFFNASVTNSQNHTPGGSYSFGGQYNSDASQVSWVFNPNGTGGIGTVPNSVYYSWWDRTDPGAYLANSDYQYGALGGHNNWSNCSVGGNNQYYPPNTVASTQTELLQVSVTGDPSSLTCQGAPVTNGPGGSAEGASSTAGAGTWTQWEWLITPNTMFTGPIASPPDQIDCNNLTPTSPGCGNGEIAAWHNGALQFDKKNLNVCGNNCGQFLGDPAVVLGGYITDFAVPPNSGDSNGRCNPFSICPGAVPGVGAPTPFNRNGDDIIILKK